MGMKSLLLTFCLSLWACNSHKCDPGPSTENFSGTNLLLDKYMTDKCFNLVECDDSACAQTVYTFEEGDMRMTNEGWAWSHEPPNLYIVEDYELDVYLSEEPECWDIEALSLDLKTMACPCPYLPLIDRSLR